MEHGKARVQLPAQCLNCSAVLTDNYCATCGQSARVSIPTFGEMVHEFTETFFHFESRFWHTIKNLVLAPGKLTSEYVAGKRVSQMPPLRLYVLLSLIFFFIGSITPRTEGNGKITLTDATGTKNEVNIAGAPDCGMDPKVLAEAPFAAQLKKACKRNEEQGGKLLSELFVKYLPLTLFMLIPVIGGILNLLFWSTHRRFIEHAIFAMHFQSAYFVLKGLSTLAEATPLHQGLLHWPALVVSKFLAWIPALYLLLAFRTHYGSGVPGAIVKTLFLIACYTVTTIIAILLESVLIVLLLH